MITEIELERMHNSLVEEKMKLLIDNGIYDTSDESYKNLPANLQEKYLSLQAHLDIVHNKMIGNWIAQNQ